MSIIDHNEVKGFHDFEGIEVLKREYLLNLLKKISNNYCLISLDLPILERASVFQKSLGKYSDIVQKQFFYLENKNKDTPLKVLRPEFSGSIMRFLQKKKFFKTLKQKNFVTFGPCFRYEKPQKNRFRQFYQWNYEQILHTQETFPFALNVLQSILQTLHLLDKVVIYTNFLSDTQLNKVQKEINKIAFKNFCKLCKKRIENQNVFRIFDCKKCANLVKDIHLDTFLISEEKTKYQKYFQTLKNILPQTKIIHQNTLTRGLDYYRGFVFEIKGLTSSLQTTLIAGGTYQLSFFNQALKTHQGFGFAIGLERLISFLDQEFFASLEAKQDHNIFIAQREKEFINDSYSLQNLLCNLNYQVVVYHQPLSFLKSFKKSLEKKSRWFLYFGKEYQKTHKILVRKISQTKDSVTKTQFLMTWSEVEAFFKNGK